MTTATATKYQYVRNQLEAAIRCGDLTAGDQLPAEQSLADQYGVSLMTARKVVCDLVAADLLERRARQGTFVRQHAVDKMMSTTVNIIVVAYDTSFQRTFLNCAIRLTEEKGWSPNVIRLAKGQQDAAVRAIQAGELALAMMEDFQPQSALALAARNAKGRIISIGLDLSKHGVPTINVAIRRSFELAVQHLRDRGHQDIVLVEQLFTENFHSLHRAAWHEVTEDLYTKSQADEHYLTVSTPRFSCPSFDAFEATRQMFAERSKAPTALVCFGEEVTQGVLAACRAAGKRVPEDVSVLNILDAPSMVFAHPSVTSIDMNFEAQIQLAFEIFDAAQAGKIPASVVHTVEPLLLERFSVAPAKSAT